MNKRISRNGITSIAREYNELLYSHDFKRYSTKGIFDAMVSLLADMLGDDNENFDRDRFFNVVYTEESTLRRYASMRRVAAKAMREKGLKA